MKIHHFVKCCTERLLFHPVLFLFLTTSFCVVFLVLSSSSGDSSFCVVFHFEGAWANLPEKSLRIESLFLFRYFWGFPKVALNGRHVLPPHFSFSSL